jgi:hypothetical protein
VSVNESFKSPKYDEYERKLKINNKYKMLEYKIWPLKYPSCCYTG